jgi:hypothetical protein
MDRSDSSNPGISYSACTIESDIGREEEEENESLVNDEDRL